MELVGGGSVINGAAPSSLKRETNHIQDSLSLTDFEENLLPQLEGGERGVLHHPLDPPPGGGEGGVFPQ